MNKAEPVRPGTARRLPSLLTWTLKIVLAAVFAAAALAKLSSVPATVGEFNTIGFGQAFRYFTGGVELLSAGLLLWPRTAFVGTLGMLGVCSGAFLAQIGPLHGDIIHVLVLGTLVLLAAWLTRPSALRARR